MTRASRFLEIAVCENNFKTPESADDHVSPTNIELSIDMKSSEDVFDTITTRRRVYTQADLENVYHDTPYRKTWKERITNKCQCSAKSVCYGLLSLVPVLMVIRRYNWRQNTMLDFMAGLSVSFMHLPQGLAFGSLAGLEAVYGLYSTFFAISFYAVFGTSHHISFGTNAVIALLTAAIVDKETELKFGPSNTTDAGQVTEEKVLEYKVGIAMAVCFVTGIILIVMGRLRLGFTTNYLAVSFIGAFTMAAGFHIASSQVSKLLGIKVKSKPGPGKMVLLYVGILRKLGETNVGDLIVGLICVAILLGVKMGINERYGKKMKMPIPIDLILVIIVTTISYFADFQHRFAINVIGEIPPGMPMPRLPNMDVVPRIAQDSFIIAILVFAMTISMAKLCASLHDYEVDSNQELVAYGTSNFLMSFFQCFPACVAPPRTMILSSMGSKTTLNAVPSAIFILIVLLVAGPLFFALPISVLAAMIIVAMKNLLLQVTQLPNLWRVSKADFVIFLTTGLVSILVDLDIGLGAGIGVSIFTIIVQSQLASGQLIGLSNQEDLYLDLKSHKHVTEMKGLKIFYFNTTLFFASADRFKSQLYSKVFNPLLREVSKSIVVADNVDEVVENNVVEAKHEAIHHIILDCSAMTYIDMAGVNVLKIVIKQYKRVGTDIFFARCGSYMLKTIESAQMYDVIPKDHVFYDIHDAVTTACKTNNIIVKL